MPICEKIRSKKRKICIADLDRLITIENREIQTPENGSVDYTLGFQPYEAQMVGNGFNEGYNIGFEGGNGGVVWAMIESVNGETVFDGHNIERIVTHRIYIPYLEGLTQEQWILAEGQRFDILDIEDLDFRHDYQLLRCTVRGTEDQSNNGL